MNRYTIDRAVKFADTTHEIVIDAGAIRHISDVFYRHFGDTPVALIADENTFTAAGKEVLDSLHNAGVKTWEPYIFPGTPRLHADIEHVLEVEAYLGTANTVPIAVGSGTINDITKMASHQLGLPYMVVATAASMDGYTSYGASITYSGFKQNVSCSAPRALLADSNVLAQSPPEMAIWGYGDLLGKIIAGADWILADALGIENLHTVGWQMVMDPLRDWLADPQRLRAGDHKALSSLLEGLVLSGLAMQAAKSSRPASGSEHLIGHLWEMAGVRTTTGEVVSHGLNVGLGALTAGALYDVVLEEDFSHLNVQSVVSSWPSWKELEKEIRSIFKETYLLEVALFESQAKYIDRHVLIERLEIFRRNWPQIQARVREQLISAKELRSLLKQAGALSSPTEIGLNAQRLLITYQQAKVIRNRYTVLDLAAETGNFSSCMDKLFAPSGFWGDL